MAFRFIACTIKMARRKHAVGTKTKLSEYIQLGSLGHVHNPFKTGQYPRPNTSTFNRDYSVTATLAFGCWKQTTVALPVFAVANVDLMFAITRVELQPVAEPPQH